MESPVLTHEPLIRLAAFFGVFALMATWELLAPRRALTVSRTVRWVNNLGLVALNTLLLRLVFPTAAVGTALLAESQGWGLLHQVQVPPWLAVGVAVVALDFAIYLQHVMFHAVPALWRLHRVHHATSTSTSPPGRASTRSRSGSRC
jgi:sterol desaturase/sphingolipid hydroxylase (fatty acid hydroxylase superfamily)